MSRGSTEVRAVHDGLFQSDPAALLGSGCDDCGRSAFPCATSCPYCGSEHVADLLLPAEGTLWGWTTVNTAPPGYYGEAPFGFGVVELANGLRVITRLAVPDATYEHGMPMHLQIVPLFVDDDGTQVETWEFAP